MSKMPAIGNYQATQFMRDQLRVLAESDVPWFDDAETRLDLREAPVALAVNIMIVREGVDTSDIRFALAQRSSENDSHIGAWNNVSGYLDDPRGTVSGATLEELREELSLSATNILAMQFGDWLTVDRQTPEGRDQKLYVLPALVVIDEGAEIVPNDENTEVHWFRGSDIAGLSPIVPIMPVVIEVMGPELSNLLTVAVGREPTAPETGMVAERNPGDGGTASA